MTRPSAPKVAKRFVVLKHCIVYALTAPPRDLLSRHMHRWSDDELESFRNTAEIKRNEFWGRLRADLWEELSPNELDLASSTVVTMTSKQQINASWRLEAAAVLLWSLGLNESLPPFDTKASDNLLRQFPHQPVEQFIDKAALRVAAALEKMRQIAELWHWRSRTRSLVEQGHRLPEQGRRPGVESYDDIVRLVSNSARERHQIDDVAEDDFVAFGKPYRLLDSKEWATVRSISVERHFTLNWLCGYSFDNLWDETPTDT